MPMKTYFYDIESLDNVFTLANFRAQDNVIELYYLVDDPSLFCENFEQRVADHIRKKNKNFTGKVELYDLTQAEPNYRLATIFGLTDARYATNPDKKSCFPQKFRPVYDTDPDYDDNIHPYLFGYNSNNYDTTELVLYLCDVISESTGEFVPGKTARQMRDYNDQLFAPKFKDCMPDRLKYYPVTKSLPGGGTKIHFQGPDYKTRQFIVRKNMLLTGRHLDVARLNEKQSKVGLKRILGMEGYQILESDKLRPGQNHIDTPEQLLDLMAYNVSDVVNLEKLFLHKTYKSNFELKRQVLKDYPELVYEEAIDEKGEGTYKPNISPYSVRNDRLTIDSSSAQIVTKALCPYGYLHDYDTVSFMYPSEAKAKELGIPRVNVLEESRKFFYARFKQPELRARFDEIYNYYKWIEGKNFNSSENYLKDHGITDVKNIPRPEDLLPPELSVAKLSQAPVTNTCLFYYNKDGSPSTCFVNFSTGGIHGAEYNKALWEYDLAQYQLKLDAYNKKMEAFRQVKSQYPNPCDLKKAKGVTIDGVKYKPSDFLKPKATKDSAFYKDEDSFAKPKELVLFVEGKSEKTGAVTYKLAPRYTYTSAKPTNHEDFVSYYPNLLRMLDAFFNERLGYDRYGEIFDNKTLFGKLMKEAGRTEEEKASFNIKRNGTKLLLNAASGAGDAGFESNIRMNNKIISMRIIGQLFSWRIGQAQTIEGASIISTNTDGLYSVMEATMNEKILERESKSIHVDIEPEPMFLISKDSNNRVEIKIENGQLTEVLNASGGSLSCRTGPTPTQSLAHPAILDWAVTEYLIMAAINYKGIGLDKPFNNEIGRSILSSARKTFNDDIHTLRMFQNVIASSPGSERFVFSMTDNDPNTPIPLQHYNRCFITKDGTPGTCHMMAAHAKVVTDAMMKKRTKNNERLQQHDPIAAEILAINGVKTSDIPMGKEATVVKISGVETEWDMLIENSDLHCMSKEDIDRILDCLDYEKYLTLFRESFEKNWFNLTPEYIIQMEENARKEKEAKKKASVPFPDTDKTAANVQAPACDAEEPASTADNTAEDNSAVSAPDAGDNPKKKPASDYDLGFGHKGNGMTVWNRKQQEAGDYKTVAHIASDCTVTIYDAQMPKEVQDRIEEVAATSTLTISASQDIPVFSTPPKEQTRPDAPDCTENNGAAVPAGDESDMDALSRIAAGTPSITDGLNLPKMVQLNRTLLSTTDIYNGEQRLHYNGVRKTDAHRILRDVMLAVTQTDIDA